MLDMVTTDMVPLWVCVKSSPSVLTQTSRFRACAASY
jgi:hypothetical protein